MSLNGGGDLADQGLDAAAQYIADALERVRNQEEELKGRLQLAGEERKRLVTALRALSPEHPLAAVKTYKKAAEKAKASKVSRVRPDLIREVWETIREQGDGDFAVKDIAIAMGRDSNDDAVRRSFTHLREGEAIRLVGKRKENGPPFQVFKVLDENAAEHVLEVNEAEYPR